MHIATVTANEAYARVVGPLIGLQMEHVYRRVLRGGADPAYALDHWTMLPTFIDGSVASPSEAAQQRGEALDALAAAMRAAGGDATRFTGRMQAWLEPFLERSLARWRSVAPEETWYGCFRYSVERAPGLVALHFYNAACPESPFADAEALRDDLRHCVHAAAREVPGVEWVHCGSWVNNLPPFQSLFPPAYVASMVATSPEAKTGFGWWGQFVTSEGSLNEARARRLLEVDEFTYARMLGRCTYAELRAHVK